MVTSLPLIPLLKEKGSNLTNVILKHNWTKQLIDIIFSLLEYLQVEIHHARSVIEIFYAVSYKKGSAVIRMLQGYLGDVTFQETIDKTLFLNPKLLRWNLVMISSFMYLLDVAAELSA